MATGHRLRVGWRFFRKQVLSLAVHPIFLILTLVGNGFMLVGAAAFFLWESGLNPRVDSFLDALWFAVTTVTSVGYGDVVPVTAAGRVLGMVLMIGGTAIFAAFTGLFASALLAPEMDEIESELIRLKQGLKSR